MTPLRPGELFPGEASAASLVRELGRKYGYGRLIQILREAWSEELQNKWHMDTYGAAVGAGFICAWCQIDSRNGKRAVHPNSPSAPAVTPHTCGTRLAREDRLAEFRRLEKMGVEIERLPETGCRACKEEIEILHAERKPEGDK